MSEGQIIWAPPLPLLPEKHVCRPPEDDGLILEPTGTVWLCRCGRTWRVVMTRDGHRWTRERAIRRWWRYARHGIHPAEPEAQSTPVFGVQRPG
jgi:hypothetical protein